MSEANTHLCPPSIHSYTPASLFFFRDSVTSVANPPLQPLPQIPMPNP